MNKIKILQYTGAMNRAGAETLLMNIYRNIDREKFEFHFITHTKGNCDYDQEIIELGGKIIYLDKPSIKNIKKFSKDFNNIIKKYGPYDAIHSHMQLLNGIIMKLANKSGICTRISHAHLNGDYNKKSIIRSIYVNYSKYLINRYSTVRISCSQESGKYLYNSNKFILMNNAIDINQFKFDKRTKYIHEELNLDHNIKIITHIGRFVEAKNHKFIIDILNEIIKVDKQYRLILVGQGELIQSIREKVKYYNLNDYVYFLGLRSDINKILSSTDVFIMPSILEGLPVVLVEAQASGVPCVISNNIPKDVDLGLGLVESISLEEDISEWVNKIKQKSGDNIIDFKIRRDSIIKNGYNLFNNINLLSNIYSGCESTIK